MLSHEYSSQVKEGEMVNPDDILDLNANAKELRKAHARLKVDVERYMGDLKHIMMKVRYLWHEV